MIRKNNIKKLEQIISELNKWQAFKLEKSSTSGKNDCYIPYMMNDALEYYVILKDCTIAGDFYSDCQEDSSAEIISHTSRPGLIIRQGENNVCTLWFHDLEIVCQCFQYHRIGHFWVQGQEQWRQLVYMVGTMYDKQKYIGENLCNQKEKELLPLMEFAPFRMWFPLSQIPSDQYPDTKEGRESMKKLALESGDKKYARLIQLYELFPVSSIANFLAHMLTHPKRAALYEHIYHKVCDASLEYPERNYGEKHTTSIQSQRDQVTHLLYSKGFEGEYPSFQKRTLRILATEEHPFTVMESNDFHFRIQFMVSHTPKPDTHIKRIFAIRFATCS